MNASDAPAPASAAPAFANILFCTDFSDNADRAFAFALRAASRNPGARLHLLHVIPEPSAQFWRGYIYGADDDADARAKHEIDAKLDSAYRPRVPASVPLVIAMRIGDAPRKILEYAAEISADLIIVGRQGTSSAVGNLLFGNVAEKIVRRSPAPVLVIPPAP